MATGQAGDYWQSQAAQVEVEGSYDGLEEVGSSTFGGQSSKVLAFILGILILLLGGYIAYTMLEGAEAEDDADIFTVLISKVDQFFADDEALPDEEVQGDGIDAQANASNDELTPPVATKDKSGETSSDAVAGNPYWALSNKLTDISAPETRWSPDEETAIRAGLTHTFRYQRYKTIQSLRKSPLLGSEAALWDAQADTGFWIRAFALLAIVEQGTDVPLSALDQAIAKAHPDLVANFFRRFVKKPTAASAYLARHAIKLLDGNGRLVALQIIANRHDGQTKSYLEAAAKDPEISISQFAKKSLKKTKY